MFYFCSSLSIPVSEPIGQLGKLRHASVRYRRQVQFIDVDLDICGQICFSKSTCRQVGLGRQVSREAGIRAPQGVDLIYIYKYVSKSTCRQAGLGR